MTELVRPLLAILRSTATIGAFDVQESIVQQLVAARTERRVDFLTTVLRATPKRDADVRLALLPVQDLCSESLAAWLSAPARESATGPFLPRSNAAATGAGGSKRF